MSIFVPLSEDVRAYNVQPMLTYHAYPLPLAKPMICEGAINNASQNDIDKTQAAAAALGLYLGIKTIYTQRHKMVMNMNCV